ncbi:MAG TPA: sulfotransferase [bacterium]|nr:sulfotransferase [bacterium]
MSPTSSPPPKGGRFFIIGAQRCGTTYLYEMMEGHPQVRLARPKRPEPKWFLDQAKAALGPQAWEKELFPDGPGPWSGEKGTSYLEHPEAASAILSVLPEARFLAILREPVARAVSNYRFSKDNGVETLPLEKALDPERPARDYDRSRFSASPFAYLERGRYVEYLEAWAAKVPKGRLHVLLFEELTGGDGALNGVWSFLGLPPHRPKDLGRIVNAAQEPMPEIPPGLLKGLRDHFEEPNRRLEKFLGRPLDAWKARP